MHTNALYTVDIRLASICVSYTLIGKHCPDDDGSYWFVRCYRSIFATQLMVLSRAHFICIRIKRTVKNERHKLVLAPPMLEGKHEPRKRETHVALVLGTVALITHHEGA